MVSSVMEPACRQSLEQAWDPGAGLTTIHKGPPYVRFLCPSLFRLAFYHTSRRHETARQATNVLYRLAEILLLVLCATIAGADDFVEVGFRGTENQDFLRRFLPYEHGIPSHDTLCDVITAIDPALFKACFLAWVDGVHDDAPKVTAIDGKTPSRSHDRRNGRLRRHTVLARASRQRLVLGQEAVSEKSNEISAIPLLLRRLEPTRAPVTIDAWRHQRRLPRRPPTVAQTMFWR
jgi:hypothetical protein